MHGWEGGSDGRVKGPRWRLDRAATEGGFGEGQVEQLVPNGLDGYVGSSRLTEADAATRPRWVDVAGHLRQGRHREMQWHVIG